MGAEDQTSFEESFSLSMLCKESELSRRMLINASTGKSRPHPHKSSARETPLKVYSRQEISFGRSSNCAHDDACKKAARFTNADWRYALGSAESWMGAQLEQDRATLHVDRKKQRSTPADRVFDPLYSDGRGNLCPPAAWGAR